MTSGGLRRRDPGGGTVPGRRRVGRAGLAVFTVAMIFVMVNVHELGHTVVAWLAGDATATYYLYRRFPDGGFCIGCNVYDPSRLSDVAAALVAVGGVLVTQAVVVAAVVAHRRAPARVRPYVAVVGAVFFLDLVVQLVQGAFRDVTDPPSGVDLADFVAIAGRGGALGTGGVRAAMLAACLLYTVALVVVVRRRRG